MIEIDVNYDGNDGDISDNDDNSTNDIVVDNTVVVIKVMLIQ